ncbi:hypothetical protein E0Z10_g181 [Xylaria hypoxylon]|uniref:PARG catalytic Macro domain-containing protein n=1 Tax=Xylaria hypoxylon TaxID=37992 RepID=A0A4Z0YVT7_9PEZI|nr:hypothetical protein E0Z10_g181 [Xylaria hypoxylon]
MTTSDAVQYLLPCSASFKCLDRFSILDDLGEPEDVDGQVPFWYIFTTLLRSSVQTPTQLAELLDTIAVTLRESPGPAGDYQLLKFFISGLQPAFFDTYWPLIVQLALELPQHFPSGSLQVLGAEEALLLASKEWVDDWYITYTLVTAGPHHTALGSSPVPLSPIEIEIVESYQTCPVQLGLPSGAAVVSANRYIGFGQSATQEEVHAGSSPETCPAVLITPPLGKNQVLVIRGAEAVLNITGQRREIKAIAQDVGVSVDWRQRTMLFMDALELDIEDDEDGLPDLTPENLTREVDKAAIAFSSGVYEVVCSPLWGCGAFGGDPFVKVALLWCAASVAHTSLKIICDSGLQEIVSSLNILVAAVRRRLETAQDLIELLRTTSAAG